MTVIQMQGHKNYVEAKRWHEAVTEVAGILDGQEYDKWKIADLLVELIPDGDPDINVKLQRFADEIGGRLKKATLTSYRRAALRFPEGTRGDNKPFWYYAQASWHQDAEEIVATSTSEYELREMLGGRDPYRVKSGRVIAALENIGIVRDIFSERLIRLWLSDDVIRQRIVSELRASHGYDEVEEIQILTTTALPEFEEVGVAVFV